MRTCLMGLLTLTILTGCGTTIERPSERNEPESPDVEAREVQPRNVETREHGRSSPPRGIRNNNPLNIRKSSIDWRGEIECSDNEFECFTTAGHGLRAAAIILHTYHHEHDVNTVRGVVERWAPPNENDTEAVYAAVSDQLEGVSRVGPANLYRLLQALVWIENGEQPYSRKVFEEAITNALSDRDSDDAWFRNHGRDNEVSRNETRNQEDETSDGNGVKETGRRVSEFCQRVWEHWLSMDKKDNSSSVDSFYRSLAQIRNGVWLDRSSNHLFVDRSDGRVVAIHQPHRNCPVGSLGRGGNNSPRHPPLDSYYRDVLWREPSGTQQTMRSNISNN